MYWIELELKQENNMIILWLMQLVAKTILLDWGCNLERNIVKPVFVDSWHISVSAGHIPLFAVLKFT